MKMCITIRILYAQGKNFTELHSEQIVIYGERETCLKPGIASL